MLMVLFASQFEVVKLVGSTISEWNPMVNLQPVGSAADDAGLVALVDEGSESPRQIRVTHVDLESRTLHVHGKGRRDRLIPLPHRVVHTVAELAVLDGLQHDDFLWYRQKANAHSSRVLRERPIVYSGFHRWWTRSLEGAGVAYKKPHTTRHTFATKYLPLVSGRHRNVLRPSEPGRPGRRRPRAYDGPAVGRQPVRKPSAPAPHGNRLEGADRIRTGVRGFAGLCLTTRPPRREAAQS